MALQQQQQQHKQQDGSRGARQSYSNVRTKLRVTATEQLLCALQARLVPTTRRYGQPLGLVRPSQTCRYMRSVAVRMALQAGREDWQRDARQQGSAGEHPRTGQRSAEPSGRALVMREQDELRCVRGVQAAWSPSGWALAVVTAAAVALVPGGQCSCAGKCDRAGQLRAAAAAAAGGDSRSWMALAHCVCACLPPASLPEAPQAQPSSARPSNAAALFAGRMLLALRVFYGAAARSGGPCTAGCRVQFVGAVLCLLGLQEAAFRSFLCCIIVRIHEGRMFTQGARPPCKPVAHVPFAATSPTAVEA